jgi:hypothetical protein
MKGYDANHVLYVVDAPDGLWMIDSPAWLRGWQPGVSVTVVTEVGGVRHVVRIRGIVSSAKKTSYGNVPNVPMKCWRCVGTRR